MDIEEKKRESGDGSPWHRQKGLPVKKKIIFYSTQASSKRAPREQKHILLDPKKKIKILRGIVKNR